MNSYQVPVLLSQYAEDVYRARVIDGPGADVCASTASTAVSLVQKHLKQQAKRRPYQYWPRIENYELHETSVKVRLFYRDGKRQFPASREMKIPIRYVLGKYVDESVECFLVDYDVVFHCPAVRELRQLIEESVRNTVAGIDSRELATAAPPEKTELRIVRVRLRERGTVQERDQTDALSIVADPLVKTQRKKRSTPIKHRDSEVTTLLKAMKDSSVLLVGDAGCGKSTITKLAATRLQNDAREAARKNGKDSPNSLVWQSSAENLIAGMQYLGEWEQRLERVITELESLGAILSVSSQIDLVRLGGSSPADSLASFLMPYMRRGELKVIAETTPEELDAARRLLPGWIECFQVINVKPLNHDQTRDIAQSMLTQAARNHRIDVDETAAETATRLFAQFTPYQPPPKGVVLLIQDAIDRARRNANPISASASEKTPLDQRPSQVAAVSSLSTGDIVKHFTRLTGLPEAILKDSMTLSVDELTKHFEEDVIGQPAAVSAAVNVVLRLKAGLCDPNRPVATMLFCGPTGVGKTQLARSLGNYLFGHADLDAGTTEKTLVRLDMSEYASWDAVDRFLMGADGEVANWIARLRERPMSVLLLDEFEKASPEVHDCLLSGLDEGRITDRFGRTTTLCGSIVVLTSNVGATSKAPVGFQNSDERAFERAAEQEFRPEFLNRLDEVVVFDALPSEVIEQIVEKELQSLASRESLSAGRVQLIWDSSVVKKLATVGFDPLLGARPLQRAIEREVVAKIAKKLLEAEQDERIKIDLTKWVDEFEG